MRQPLSGFADAIDKNFWSATIAKPRSPLGNGQKLILQRRLLMAKENTQFKPLLTIATINLNNSKGLERTIESFRPLRENNEIEFIFQDGASSDNSIKVATDFYRYNEIESNSDFGVYDAMNKTLKRANGDFIIWINSGDEIISNEWAEIKKTLLESEADLIIFSMQIIFENGKIDTRCNSIENISRRIPHPASIFKASTARTNGGYSMNYKIAADLDLILRLARNKSTVTGSNCIISRFYTGGLSYSPKVWFETSRTLLSNGVTTKSIHIVNCIKYYLAFNFPFFNKFRLKLTTIFGEERKISLYDIGAVHSSKLSHATNRVNN